MIKDESDKSVISYANVVLKTPSDGAFVTGTITDEEGRFVVTGIKPGNYVLEVSMLGYANLDKDLYVGSLSEFLDVGALELKAQSEVLGEVLVTAKQDEIGSKLDKKTFDVADNVSQSGGSVLQAMQNLPGVAVQEGKVALRGNDKVTILIDGKQTALTGFGSQSGLDNLPASSIDKIEIINNPSTKYDANGNAGIINIISKKSKKEGWNGKIGLATGLGALWVRRDNLPLVNPQYQRTPKINPSLSLNYIKGKISSFVQIDNLYTHTLNKNEFVTRTYDNGTVINQQTRRNRNTNFLTSKAGVDWKIDNQNTISLSGLFGSEKILDHGEEPFYNGALTERLRLWNFLEDELKTTAMGLLSYQHQFKQAGHKLNAGINYTFHREDEKYFFDNILPTFTGKDAFKLLSDEHVADFNLDYVKPLKAGRIETGFKFRYREIPTNMLFIPGLNSPLDTSAGGWATYKETIPAAYTNYIYETNKLEAEVGLRIEYVGLNYDVNPNHRTYKSDGYNYIQPFPSMRLSYKMDDNNRLSLFYNRRVDRPNEVDIRIFPKYDDAEIIKVGNPALKPQFTNAFEIGYKRNWDNGYFYASTYHKIVDGTITRIASSISDSPIIYAIFQNVDKSYNTGIELLMSEKLSKAFSFNINLNAYRNRIDAFTVENLYPVRNTFKADQQEITSGNLKINTSYRSSNGIEWQITGTYLAPDIIPQGKILSRYSIDAGLKKSIQKGKGEIFVNVNDLFNTLVIKKEINGASFNYTSQDYYETQVVRLGYNYKF